MCVMSAAAETCTVRLKAAGDCRLSKTQLVELTRCEIDSQLITHKMNPFDG